MNGELSWLNMGFPTFASADLPPAELRAYNQIVNCCILLATALAAHWLALTAFARLTVLR